MLSSKDFGLNRRISNEGYVLFVVRFELEHHVAGNRHLADSTTWSEQKRAWTLLQKCDPEPAVQYISCSDDA